MKFFKSTALALAFTAITSPLFARDYKGPLTPANYPGEQQQVAKDLNFIYHKAAEAAKAAQEGHCTKAIDLLDEIDSKEVHINNGDATLNDAIHTVIPSVINGIGSMLYSPCRDEVEDAAKQRVQEQRTLSF
ncbi:MAG: hypothetical protein PHW63_05225 [Alphaproteobacteria bacterium]|nr:hypothetical protein [Alphaproteobacteria bacterium]